MAIVQINGQDFLLQDQVFNTPHFFDSGAGRGELYSLALLGAINDLPLITPTYIEFDNAAIRGSYYSDLKLLRLGPFRPRSSPSTGYVYPRRIS